MTNIIPEDIKELIEDIMAYEDKNAPEEDYLEPLYAELPVYDIEEERNEESDSWKIEIEL